jgi:hypothetical protein
MTLWVGRGKLGVDGGGGGGGGDAEGDGAFDDSKEHDRIEDN